MLINIALALVGISFIIIVHELGHYLTARSFNIRVKRFSLGFGPTLLRYKTRAGTDFVFGILLLGGYVLFETKEDATPKKAGRFYEECPPLIRMAVLIAAPLTNLLLAYLFYVLIAMLGSQGLKPVIGQIYPNTPAAKSELQVNDQITHIGAKQTETWQEVIRQLIANLGRPDVAVRLLRDEGKEQTAFLPLEDITLADFEKSDPATIFGMQGALPQLEARVFEVIEDTPAALAGMLAEDKILAIDDVVINSWEDFSEYVKPRANQEVSVKIQRGDQILSLSLRPSLRQDPDGTSQGFIGIRAAPLPQEEWAPYLVVSRSSFTQAWGEAVTTTRQWVALVLRSFYELVTGSLSFTNLSGPIGIVKYTGDSVSQGVVSFLSILAFISLSLFIFNLLPLPMLDGGQLLLCFIELARGRPLSPKVQSFFLRLGIMLFILLFVLVTFNDIAKLL